MSIPVLNDLYSEIRRLSAAGSTLASGDYGLKKLLPQLKKMGESSPVFAKLGSRVEDLCISSENSEEKLLELLVLLNAILYTQGNWEVKGNIEELNTVDNDCSTTLGYRRLNPIVGALTSKGGGRYNIIVDAFNEGVFAKKDKRLIYPIAIAVEDPYFEISDFVIKNIVPIYGEVLLPIIKCRFNLKGAGADSRRLRAIYAISGSSEMELYKLAAMEGSAEVKLSAMEILNLEKAPDSIFEELAKDKKKEIRDAAEAVLESRKTGTVEKLFRFFGNAFR